METLLQDLRFGLRALRRDAGSTAAALAALILGIASTTAIFSVVDAVLLRPLPLPEPDRLVRVYQTTAKDELNQISPANYQDIREGQRVFAGIAPFYTLRWNLRSSDGVEKIRCGAVGAQFLSVLGVRPQLGRDFAPEEEYSGREKVVIVSEGFWRRVFGGSDSALGKTIQLNDLPFTVAGVLPRGFSFPGFEGVELLTPIGFDAEDLKNRGSHFLNLVARLKTGVSLGAARAGLLPIAEHIAQVDAANHTGWRMQVRGLREEFVDPLRPALALLGGAVVLVLLIACANVAGLFIARGAARQREIAVRTALGGGRGRIVRQLLTESAVLGAGAGALGLLLAYWLVDAIVSLAPAGLPRFGEVHVDLRIALAAIALGVASGCISGVWPALQASRADVTAALRDSSPHSSAGTARGRARRFLVVAEVALAIVVVVGAGLLLRSFQRLLDVQLGFRPEGVLTAQVGVPFERFKHSQPYADFFEQLVERAGRIPGVRSAAAVTWLPLDLSGPGQWGNGFSILGREQPPPGQELNAQLTWVTPGYFGTMGIPLRAGRTFDGHDRTATQPVVMVNETFARRHFPGESAVGHRLRIANSFYGEGQDKWEWTIVGVVSDTHELGLDQDSPAGIFVSVLQQGFRSMNLVLRSDGDPSATARDLRRELQALDPTLPLAQVRPVTEVLRSSLAPRRFQLTLISAFGLLALALAGLGLYAVIAHSVTQRTHEFGIRLALGAGPRNVLAMVVRQGLGLAAVGVALGIASALGATQLLRSTLFGVSAADPITYAMVAALLLALAALASFLPALRATRVDPAVALRAE